MKKLREVVGWEERYKVACTGKIFRINDGKKYEISSHKNDKGYSCVNMTRPGLTAGSWSTTEKTKKFVHVLVAQAFCENPDPIRKRFVNHKDKNRSNNHWTNLEWVTHLENCAHRDGKEIE